jgi:hypothetical protein
LVYEPDKRIARIRLSDKISRLHPRHVVPKPRQAYEAAGVTSLKGIAKALNDSGVLTPAGRAYWHAMQVARVL